MPFSGAAVALLDSLPLIGDEKVGPVFTPTDKTPIAAFDQHKTAFDAKCPIAHWTIHDLRRTARSLMSRAGVNADHAERAIGHVIGGIRGIYDERLWMPRRLYPVGPGGNNCLLAASE